MSTLSFYPTLPEKLQDTVQLLRKNPSVYVQINEAYEINEKMDGKDGLSPLEECVYASIVTAKDSRQAGLDGYYYLVRSLISGENALSYSYHNAQEKLRNSLISTYKVSNEELRDIRVKAYTDHYLENNDSAKKLKEEDREDLVEAVAKIKVTRSPESKDAAKALFEELLKNLPNTNNAITNYTHLITKELSDKDLNNELRIIIKKNVAVDITRDKVAAAKSK